MANDNRAPGTFRCDPERDRHLYKPEEWAEMEPLRPRVTHRPTGLTFELDMDEPHLGPGSLADFFAYLKDGPSDLPSPARLDELGRAAIFAMHDATQRYVDGCERWAQNVVGEGKGLRGSQADRIAKAKGLRP